MILTEEQRAAIKLAMKYIARWPFAYKELHARGVLQAMIDSSEHFTDTSKMIGFDLERARDAVKMCNINKAVWAHGCAKHLPGAIDLIELQTAEIERLRGEMENYGDDYVCQMKSKDARIQELEDALVEERVIGEGGFRAEQCEFWYIEDLPEESCMELDGPCDWAKCPRKHELCDVAYQQLAEEGKIGPDADAKPRSWQITDERKAAIQWAEEMAGDCKAGDVLRDMLAEVTR